MAALTILAIVLAVTCDLAEYRRDDKRTSATMARHRAALSQWVDRLKLKESVDDSDESYADYRRRKGR
jgi:hypothetical protein